MLGDELQALRGVELCGPSQTCSVLSRLLGVCASLIGTIPAYKGTAMLAGSTGKHIARAGRLGAARRSARGFHASPCREMGWIVDMMKKRWLITALLAACAAAQAQESKEPVEVLRQRLA